VVGLATQKTTGQSEERLMNINENGQNRPVLSRAPEKGSLKIYWDGFWYLYHKFIFSGTSKLKIKLQKGVQYKTFKWQNTFLQPVVCPDY